MTEIIEWDRGENVRLNITYSNIGDVAYDPDTIELRIYNPSGTLVDTVTYVADEIKRDAVGVYYYDYSIPTDAILGWYITKWIGVSGTFTDVSKGQFKVRDSLEILYCTYQEVWNRAGIDEDVATQDEVIPFIKDSMAEIDSMMAKTFSYGNNVTQWFDTDRNDPEIVVNTIFLRQTPIISITSVEEYDINNDLVTTHESDDYWINLNTGTLRLNSTQFVKQKHRVKVVFSYGYEAIPRNISALCANISAMRLLIHQIGGTYDDVTSWNAAGLNISVGEPYMNMSRNVEFLQKEATRLIASIGRLKPSAIIL